MKGDHALDCSREVSSAQAASVYLCTFQWISKIRCLQGSEPEIGYGGQITTVGSG